MKFSCSLRPSAFEKRTGLEIMTEAKSDWSFGERLTNHVSENLSWASRLASVGFGALIVAVLFSAVGWFGVAAICGATAVVAVWGMKMKLESALVQTADSIQIISISPEVGFYLCLGSACVGVVWQTILALRGNEAGSTG